MWLLTIEDYEGLTTYHRLSRERYRLGRSPDNDFVLAQLNVSRHHARLERSGSLWLYRDEGSLLGSYVNCGLVFAHEPVPLDDGAVVQFGDYVLRLSREAPDGSLTPTPRYVAPARVRALSGPLAGAEHVFGRDQVVSIGRSDDCTLRIVHPDISMVHALIRPLPGGRHELVDRSDDGRLFINGRKLVADRALEGGDSIDVGGVVIFRYLEASQQSDPSFDECWGEPIKASLARLRVRPLVADEGAASASRVNVAAAAVRAEEVLQAAGAASLAEAASPSRGNEAASARSEGAASARGGEAASSRSDGAASARGGEPASARADGEASLRADAAGGPRGGGAALLRADAAVGPRGGGAEPGVRAGIVTSALRMPSTRPPPSEGSSSKGVPMLLDERVEAAGPVSLPSPKPASASYQRLRLATIGLGPDSQGRQRGVVLGRELEGPRVDADGPRPRGASAWPLAASPEVEASLEGRMARGDDALAAGPPEPPAEHWYRRYRAFRAAEAMLVVAAAFGAMLGLRRALPAHEMKP
ncbi:MAG TPA: FHA domain-containing protein, partial [Polyangiaceae bacterium]|nr:FHA domain-containing protein [Polyangiaceae bacterium]